MMCITADEIENISFYKYEELDLSIFFFSFEKYYGIFEF